MDTDSAESKTAVKKTVREGVIIFLEDQSQGLMPAEIACGSGLNTNSVRREVRQMAKDGLLTREGHAYRLSKPKSINEKPAEHA